jgi:AraC-like DNA-binding protein
VAEVRGGTEHSIVAALFDEIEGAESYSLPELLGRYRRLLLTLAEAIEAPALADREAKLRRARAYIAERFTEPVTLRDAAKVAGFAPSHFSRLFKAWQGTTFERYLFDLRLARAKELLHNTDIGVERVALQSGFGSPIYFFQAFRRATSTTPAEYRREARGPGS